MRHSDDSPRSPLEARLGPLELLRRNRDFRLLYASTLISFGGDWFLFVALAGLVFSLTRSPSLVALLIAANTVPFALATFVAGPLADRLDRRRLMIGADLVRGVLALGFFLVDTRSEVWIVYALVAAIAALAALFEPTALAAVPNVVEPEELPAGNALQGSAWGTMLAVGAAVGGLVVAVFGRSAGYVADSASFFVSAALLAGIRRPFSEPRRPDHEHPGLLESTGETIRYARKDHRVLALLAVKGGFGFATGVIGLLPVLALEVFNAGERGTGFLYAFRGAGALIGPLLASKVLRDWSIPSVLRAIAVSLFAFGAFYTLVPLSPTLLVAGALVLAAHLGGGVQWTLSTYGLQTIVPDGIRGRVLAFDYGLVTLTLAFSSAIAGAAADRWGVRGVILAMGVVGLIYAAAWTKATSRVRRATSEAPEGRSMRV